MRKLHLLATVLLSAMSFTAMAAEKYKGPVPAKADIPYLMHADHLVETEVAEAKDETRKDAQVATLAGATTKARTPLAEPIFILKTERLVPERLQAYRMEVRNGNREVVVSQKKGKGVAKPIHLTVSKLSEGLYKIEVDEPLENGQYTLSPEGSNQTFSFEIY